MGVARVVAHANHAYLRFIPDVVVIDFCDSDIEPISRSRHQTSDYAFFLLERPAASYQKFATHGSYDHAAFTPASIVPALFLHFHKPQ
jgi:hypothetical protein